SFFFFSSRRRHTRSKRDWSSDVCSSDLTYWAQRHLTQRPWPQPRPQRCLPFPAFSAPPRWPEDGLSSPSPPQPPILFRGPTHYLLSVLLVAESKPRKEEA